MNQPLENITVLDLSMLLPGPFCSMIMADFGARVIKIERPGSGDLMRDYPYGYPLYSGNFAILNRNKESLTLNIKSEEGRSVFFKLVERGDILIEGFRPGVMDRLGFGYKTLSKINQGLIYCSISGFGQEGPYRDLAGHDLNYIGLNGILDLTGERKGAPVVPGILVSDIGGGAYPALVGILLALLRRNATGKGQYIDISMFDGSFFWLFNAAGTYFTSGVIPTRGKELTTGGSARYQVYPTKDGRYLAVGALEDHFWMNLCDLLDIEDPRIRLDDWENADFAIEVLTEKFKSKTSQEWAEAFQGKDVCASVIRDFGEATSDSHFELSNMIQEISGSDGKPQKILGNPIRMSETAYQIRHAAPVLGQDNEKILRELGYSNADYKTFIDKSVI
jgi:crotonobetainyl-CoA:carnitine CoA-transferase CaiB-like acyl-CoA transferase